MDKLSLKDIFIGSIIGSSQSLILVACYITHSPVISAGLRFASSLQSHDAPTQNVFNILSSGIYT